MGVLSKMGDVGFAALASKLDAEQADVRLHVARALGRLGVSAAPYAEMLARSLAYEKDIGVQRAAIDALPRLGPDGMDALSLCIRITPNPDVRQRATDALEDAGDAGQRALSWHEPLTTK